MSTKCTVCCSPRLELVTRQLETMTPLRQIAQASGLSVSSLGRHSLHARKALVLAPPPADPATADPATADPATGALSFLAEMSGVLDTLATVENAARNSGAAGLLLASAKVRAGVLESLRRGVGADPVAIRDRLMMTDVLVTAIGYACTRLPQVAPIMSSFFAAEAADTKSKLSTSTRADLARLAEKLAALHADTDNDEERDPNSS